MGLSEFFEDPGRKAILYENTIGTRKPTYKMTASDAGRGTLSPIHVIIRRSTEYVKGTIPKDVRACFKYQILYDLKV